MGSKITFPAPPPGFDVNAFFAAEGLTLLNREKTEKIWTVEVQETLSAKMEEALAELVSVAAGISSGSRFEKSPNGTIWEKTIDNLGIISTDEVV